jgi:hypothetical protein
MERFSGECFLRAKVKRRIGFWNEGHDCGLPSGLFICFFSLSFMSSPIKLHD